MKHLKYLSRAARCNAGAWILFLIILLLKFPTTVALHPLTPLTNQLQPSKNPNTSHLLNSQMSWLQEYALIKPSNQATHQKSINMMDEVELNLTTHNSEMFDGYNLIGLIQQNRTDTDKKNCSFLITNMKGEIIVNTSGGIRDTPSIPSLLAKFINSTTILLAMKDGAVLWNIYDNTTVPLNFWGHHEYEYNFINNTFFTFSDYVIKINGMKYGFDVIEEYTTTGQLIWSLDTQSFISYTQWCPYRDMISDFRDVTHSNSLFFDPKEDVLYVNVRNVNTFYKIDHKTGQVHWGLGEHGNFTLFDRRGNPRKNLFYHAHAVEKVDDNTFILFDNDYHNQTNPNNQRSRLLEITINETTMTANESWAWIAPPDYYSPGLGDADRLPNGNRLGTFGNEWHPDSNIGARLVEVNAAGQIVWELNFPNTKKFLYSVYRMERFRLTPILSSPHEILVLSRDNVVVSWQTWYNFRTTRQMRGTYTLYLDGKPIKTGPHMFNKFWRPTNLTFNLGRLEAGVYNLTVALADEAGHLTTDSLNLSIIKSFYINREGLQTIELGQEDVLLHWKGDTPNPLLATITRNNTQVASFMWNGSVITLDLNSFDVGTYFVTLHLFNNTERIYEDRFLVTIYPAAAPSILSAPENQSLVWNASFVLSWKLFDHIPAFWRIFVNNTLITSETWETQSYQLHWSVPALDEGHYNITLVAYDHIDQWTARTTWLTIVSPSPPVIATGPRQTEIQWGQENVSLSWEVHGGTHWTLWKNRTSIYSGNVASTRIEVRIENWQQEEWHPGTYNLTLQVVEEGGTAALYTSWIQVLVNFGDAYADSVVTAVSMWYFFGENALGPPDGAFTRLYAGYGNGHVTLDMGLGEEIIDGNGVDFTVYARGGEYVVFVGNNLSVPQLVENQMSVPLISLGEGIGNKSFDLASTSWVQARYIQIVYLKGEEVELDAVVAIYFNQPPRPASNLDRWRIPISGGVLALFAIVVLWVRKRK